MTSTVEPHASGGSIVTRLALHAGFVLFALMLVDVLIGRPVARSSLVRHVVDIQSPSILAAKARHLAALPGRKVILLGDSLVAGQTMREHGDNDWRNHTISSVMQQRFDQKAPGDFAVLNLGMNGVLPADLETLVDALLPMKPHAFIIDVGLRSFSLDFSTPEAMHSRTWLKPGLHFDEYGRIAALSDQSSFESGIERLLMNNWATYRLRDLLRARYLNGEPRDVVMGWRKRLEGRESSAAPQGPAAEMQLLLQVRRRYASSNLEASNPQFAAWVRLLNKLRDAKQRAIVFYATESPRLLPSLMDSELYLPLVQKLKASVAREGGGFVSYLDGNPALTDDLFLDHVHVDAHGNALYVDSLMNALTTN